MDLSMRNIARCRVDITLALASIERAMTARPGPYPDPKCPIDRWQMAHEHILAAKTLLEME